jgi:L-seryl-tRNA(Ser) seleniumtransferase
MLLILDTFARGREVLVARAHLVEIGGGFRLPDVVQRSGARLVEVGATNKAYVRDFERALTIDTALLLRSHPSNFRMDGFVEEVEPRELVALGKRVGVPVVEDLGSGALVDTARFGLPHERTVQEAVAEGIELVAFSGDKLLGGPQAGVIVGNAALIARMRANPLLRALRVDKTTLAALAATLRAYEPGGDISDVPLYAMLAMPVEELERRAHGIVALLGGAPGARIAERRTEAYAGGGALPLAALPSAGVALVPDGGDPNAFAAELRAGRPPLIARVDGDAVIADLRTIPPQRDVDVAALLAAAMRGRAERA